MVLSASPHGYFDSPENASMWGPQQVEREVRGNQRRSKSKKSRRAQQEGGDGGGDGGGLRLAAA